MATSLTARLDIPADPAAAYRLLTDPDYVREVAAATGGTDIDVSVTATDEGGATVVARRSVPAEVPSYAKSLVGDSIRLDETRVLGPASADGSREGTLSIDFGTAPASVAGTLRLAASGAGTGIDIELTIKASVPFVGGKIEKLVAGQIHAALDREQAVAATRAP